jgi:hypothetical protein
MIRVVASNRTIRLATAGVAALLLTLSIASRLVAQVIALEGGTSTLLKTSGGEADYRWNDWSGFLSCGYAGGLHMGALAQTNLNGYHLLAGDTQETFHLDSDLFEPGMQGFAARGLEVGKSYEGMSWSVFAGTSALQRYFAFYHTYQPDLATGAAFFNWNITQRWTFRSDTVVQDKFTSLQSLRYALRKHWAVVGAAGVGRNQYYYSAGTDLETARFHLTAGYSGLGAEFERFTGINAVYPERKGPNVRLSFHPVKKWMLYASHEEMSSRTFYDPNAPLRDVGLNTVGANGAFHGFQVNANATQSRSGELWTDTQNFSVSRPLWNQFLRATGIVTQVNDQYGKNRFYIAMLEERVSSRLSVHETYTHSGQQDTITAGGQLLSNRITLGVDQQLVYNTLAFGGRSVFHAWTVNARLPLVRGVRLNVNSVIDPTGHVRYTAFLDGLFFSRDNSYLPGMDASSMPVSFDRFMVRGVVQDEAGKPVWGIAVQVDNQVAFSDTTGQFYLRFRRSGMFPVYVRPEQSIAPVPYAAVSVPVTAEAQAVENATPIVIVVRRAPTAPAPPPPR